MRLTRFTATLFTVYSRHQVYCRICKFYSGRSYSYPQVAAKERSRAYVPFRYRQHIVTSLLNSESGFLGPAMERRRMLFHAMWFNFPNANTVLAIFRWEILCFKYSIYIENENVSVYRCINRELLSTSIKKKSYG
jgi:hypothetical protein